MVGIRDRAGRCNSCKQQKIKCDLSRPTCARCHKLGLKCEYSLLRKGDVFVNLTKASPFVPTLDTTSVANGAKRLHQPTNDTSATKVRLTHGASSLQMRDSKRLEGIPAPPDPRHQNSAQLLSNFLDIYLPKDNAQIPIFGRTPATWVHLLAGSSFQSTAYNTSLAALCTNRLGAWNRDGVMVNESVRLYASALQELRADLMKGRIQKDSTATLASIVILSTYETFSPATERGEGWISHVRGGSRILQVLGPEEQKTAVGQQLSARIRTLCIFEAFRTRKTATIAEMEWPHDNPDIQRLSLFDSLHGLMIKVPYIMEALDLITAQKCALMEDLEQRRTLIDLLRWCFDINTRLLTWYKDLQYQANGELYTILPAVAQNPADDGTLGKVFPFAIHFRALSLAQLVLLYWSAMILLYRTTGDIQSLISECDDHTIPKTCYTNATSTTETIHADAHAYHPSHGALYSRERHPLRRPLRESIACFAANICQSVEYCYRSENGTLGPQSTVLPIWAAEEFYASQPALHRELHWCSEIGNMKAPGSRFDLKVMKLRNNSPSID